MWPTPGCLSLGTIGRMLLRWQPQLCPLADMALDVHSTSTRSHIHIQLGILKGRYWRASREIDQPQQCSIVVALWQDLGPLRVCPLAQNAVLEGGALGRGEGRTLVFAGDVAAANNVAGILTEAGLQPLVYHKGVSQADRESALAMMRTRQAPMRTQDCCALLRQPPKIEWESSEHWKAALSQKHNQYRYLISASV